MANDGRRPATALFKEWREDYKPEAKVLAYTEGIYSVQEFHDVFLGLMDLTEYGPAIQLVGDWDEWNRLKRDSKRFRESVEAWKKEVQIKMGSIAIGKAISLLDCGAAATELSAAKMLDSLSSNVKQSKRGRPRKADIDKAAREIAQDAQVTADDMKRVQDILSTSTITQ